MHLQAPLVMLYMVVKEPNNVGYESMGILDTPYTPLVILVRYS